MPTAAIFTISDSRSRGDSEDRSGPAAAAAVQALGFDVVHTGIAPDEIEAIRRQVRSQLASVRLIVTTGGTGISPRDVTPEAIEPLFTRTLPGFGELMRTATYDSTPLSIISRGGAGLAGQTLVIMLPGSPRGVVQCLELLGPAIRHICKILEGAPPNCEQAAAPQPRK